MLAFLRLYLSSFVLALASSAAIVAANCHNVPPDPCQLCTDALCKYQDLPRIFPLSIYDDSVEGRLAGITYNYDDFFLVSVINPPSGSSTGDEGGTVKPPPQPPHLYVSNMYASDAIISLNFTRILTTQTKHTSAANTRNGESLSQSILSLFLASGTDCKTTFPQYYSPADIAHVVALSKDQARK